ncbi:hypothetical protein APHAL10511_006321 [Amanita phalloides]|nr:hypothetical protein APHAL10511_006321 [Amanita phalloides]
MFGQFRQVVGSLETPAPRRSADIPPDDLPNGSRPSTPLSSTQLAESALNNLRKSIAAQRGQNASPVPRTPSSSKKLSLEDRLRASLAPGDVKQSAPPIPNSQNAPSLADPQHISSSSHVSTCVSPRLIPLSDSPLLSPELEKPLEDIIAQTSNVIQEYVQDRSKAMLMNENEDCPNIFSDGIEQTDIESLQERLKQVERRFLDVSESFKKLQANKAAVDDVLHDLTPLQTADDTVALCHYLKSLISKNSSYEDDINNFQAKVQKQEQHIQDLSEKHNSELLSQQEANERLKSQLNEAEALFKASQQASSEVQEGVHKQDNESQKLQADLEQAKNAAREEEEKRVKAISLLKTVRQKLVKTEKEREEALKEVTSLKQREQGDKEKEQAEKLRLQEELNIAKADKEKANAKIKAQSDKELGVLRERYDKELSVLKGQYELESVTLKASHSNELSSKASQIATLGTSLNNITRDKNQMFDQLQMRQAEVESVQSHLESLQNQNAELQYQLREAQDRIALLTYDLQEAQREHESRSHQVTTSPEEVARLLSSMELKYEAKIAEIKIQLRQVETERNDRESDWSRKVRDRAKEVDDLRNLLEKSARTWDDHEKLVGDLRAEKDQLQEEARLSQQQITDLISAQELMESIEKSAKEREIELTSKMKNLEQQIEEAGIREAHLRVSNRTLREELRKVQSSVTLLERQRSPGIGYRPTRTDESAPIDSRSSIQSDTTSRANSPVPLQNVQPAKNEEDINLEYLRNVILQFLEHKEMRPNLETRSQSLKLDTIAIQILASTKIGKIYLKLMTLAELTRNCFQNGISAAKWMSLCKLYVSKQCSIQVSEEVEHNLNNSVLVLYRSYPGDPDLHKYLRYAVESGMVSVPVFTTSFLSAARSSELHTAETLDSLCRIAINAHYSSGSSTILSQAEPLNKTMNTIQDALALLRTAHSLPMSYSTQLTSSASELLMLLLSSISDMSQIPARQAIVFISDTNELLQSFHLLLDVRQMLERFVLSLSLLIGDDAKAATEAQLLHTLHYPGPFNKGDGIGSSSDGDIVTFSLVLHHLVTYRGYRFGSGSGSDPVALLVSIYRWTSWTPTTFYTQLFTAAFTCISQSMADAPIWKAFIVGRLPGLLSAFRDVLAVEGAKIDWHSAMHTALSTVFLRPDLIVQADVALSRSTGKDDAHEEMSQSFTRDLLLQLVACGLISTTFAAEKDPGVAKDTVPRLRVDSQDSGLDLEVRIPTEHSWVVTHHQMEVFIESRLSLDVSVADVRVWMERISKDVLSHATFAYVTHKRFTSLASMFDVEALSHLCRILYTYDFALDIVSLHVKISDLVYYALLLLDEYDCETVGDPQTAVSHLGDIVLFAQCAIARFHLNHHEFTNDHRSASAEFTKSIGVVLSQSDFSNDDRTAYNAWYRALFDSNNEGIEDSILRTTKPRTLLRISATLFLDALQASSMRKIDPEVLSNGVSYFTGPILNWTLVGVINALIREIRRQGLYRMPHLETLQTLLLSPTCPRPILCLCASQILEFVSDKKRYALDANTFNADSVRRVVADALGWRQEETTVVTSKRSGLASEEQLRRVVRTALAMARAGKGPVIDVERCLSFTSPSNFLEVVWSELAEAANVGDTERCRRLATFTLTMPRSTATPPLLPIFIHLVVPVLITRIDQQQASEQAIATELLVSLISSALTAALHLEWAVQTVISEHRSFLGQTTTSMARRLADDLRARKSSGVSTIILQRLTASQTFVANFPVFIAN